MAYQELCSPIFYEMTNEEYAAFGVKNCAILKYEF